MDLVALAVDAGFPPPSPAVAEILNRLNMDRGPLTIDRIPWAISTQLAERDRGLVADWMTEFVVDETVREHCGAVTADEALDDARQAVALMVGGRWW
jgi:hypothetical protein